MPVRASEMVSAGKTRWWKIWEMTDPPPSSGGVGVPVGVGEGVRSHMQVMSSRQEPALPFARLLKESSPTRMNRKKMARFFHSSESKWGEIGIVIAQMLVPAVLAV
jgi:hypothetical protein